MVDDTAIAVLAHPARTPTALAEVAAGALSCPGMHSTVLGLEPPATDVRVEHLVVIFPVLGDERIPSAVDRILAAWAGRSRTHSICLTGDFRAGQRVSEVAVEADQILARGGSVPARLPLLIDTPAQWPAAADTLATWLGQPRRGAVEEPLRQLLDLLPQAPRYRVDGKGKCVSLSLVNAAAYPRSILVGLDAQRLREVLSLVSHLPQLQWLSIAFADMESLPAPLPSGLRGLDVRGNRLADLDDVLSSQLQLIALNVAACDLMQLPRAVGQMPGLATLVAAKNRITDLPDWLAGCHGLRRLTIYRNALERLDGHLFSGSSIELLNLGANAIDHLPVAVSSMEHLTTLGLRLLPLTQLPDFLASMPALRFIDVSKTSVPIPASISASSITLLQGMPAWAWDDAQYRSG